MIDCREAVRRMWAYLEHELPAAPTAEFETHLDACQRCCGELEFSRHLREMVVERAAMPAVPADVRARIDELIAEADPTAEGPR